LAAANKKSDQVRQDKGSWRIPRVVCVAVLVADHMSTGRPQMESRYY